MPPARPAPNQAQGTAQYAGQVSAKAADTAAKATVKTPVGEAPIVPLALMLIGGWLLFYSVHYWREGGWPTTPLRSVLQGKGLPAQSKPASEASQLESAVSGAQSSAAAAASGTTSSSTAAAGTGYAGTGGTAVNSTAASNQNIGKLLAASYGWSTGSEWDDLVQLWNRESGWDNTVWNGGSHADTRPAGSSGAYGIAQSLPYTKYPKAGWPPGYGGTADPTSQISWGLAYIHGGNSYGATKPSEAWAHEQANGWY